MANNMANNNMDNNNMDTAMKELNQKFSQLSTNTKQPIETKAKRKADNNEAINHRPAKTPRMMAPQFKYFSKLPAELQHTIWEMAAPKDRVVACFLDSENHDREDRPTDRTAPANYFWLKSAAKDRAGMDAACYDSRKTLQKIGFVKAGALGCRSHTNEYYNPKGDIFLLDIYCTNFSLGKLTFTGVERLAIYSIKFGNTFGAGMLLDSILQHAPSCREVTFVYADKTCMLGTGGVPRSDKLRLDFLPHTQQVGCFDYPYMVEKWNLDSEAQATWQQVKETIEYFWKEKATMDGTPLAKIPTLVGAQVEHSYEMFDANPYRQSLVRDEE
ncbi:hypothetical protein CDD82_7910 [Ophiocordyceps australis]|uniref:2EXR domain-containing protein n=1 Tax=Ophiocordyceps australis TaxID=1399860 RepID=A0A2C5XE76_9HYPO|nr:hypothetical protein CDD82_7910 [Ophiocordyceps australis]